jgi:hypothetical protein
LWRSERNQDEEIEEIEEIWRSENFDEELGLLWYHIRKYSMKGKEQQEAWESFGKLAEALLLFSLKENNTRENYIYLQLLQSDLNLF